MPFEYYDVLNFITYRPNSTQVLYNTFLPCTTNVTDVIMNKKRQS